MVLRYPALPGQIWQENRAIRAAEIVEFAGAPGRVRTSNPRFRRPILYPVELRAHKAFFFEAMHKVGTTSITATIYHYVGNRQAMQAHSGVLEKNSPHWSGLSKSPWAGTLRLLRFARLHRCNRR